MKTKKILLFFMMITGIYINAQVQIGSSILGDSSNDNLGRSTALSADGTILAVGMEGNDANGPNAGIVRVYRNVNNTWTQIGSDINGGARQHLGASVSLSDNGEILAVGGYNYYHPGVTKVFRYDHTTNAWTQIGADINGLIDADFSGYTINLNSDGSVLVIGEMYGGTMSLNGQVRIFNNVNDTWVQKGTTIQGLASDDSFGRSVALSDDGNTLVVGAPMSSANGTTNGQVRVFKFNGTDWLQLGQSINGEDQTYLDENTGHSVSINGNGTIIAVGAKGYSNNYTAVGRVRIFKLNGNTWQPLGNILSGDDFNYYDVSQFGVSVKLNNAGYVLAVGANGAGLTASDYQGIVHVFEFNTTNNTWEQAGNRIMGDQNGDNFGIFVELDNNGDTLAVGATGVDAPDTNQGEVKVYDLTNVLSVDDSEVENFSVFPNPTKGIFNIDFDNFAKVILTNETGQIVKTFQREQNQSHTFDISGLNPGIYFVQIINNNGVLKTMKLIKK